MTLIRFYSLLVLLSFCVACELFEEKEPKTELEKLPPITTTGENTFGCLVNGKAWVPKSSVDATSFYQIGTVFIAADLSSPDQSIGMFIFENVEPIMTGHRYDLTDTLNSGAEFFSRKGSALCDYTYKATIEGTIELLELNTEDYTVSGVFTFTTTVNSCDTIHVTDGRFDLHYAP